MTEIITTRRTYGPTIVMDARLGSTRRVAATGVAALSGTVASVVTAAAAAASPPAALASARTPEAAGALAGLNRALADAAAQGSRPGRARDTAVLLVPLLPQKKSGGLAENGALARTTEQTPAGGGGAEQRSADHGFWRTGHASQNNRPQEPNRAYLGSCLLRGSARARLQSAVAIPQKMML